MTSKPIYWHQGLFLQPQHFQHLDAYHQQMQQAIRQATSCLPWGVASYELDHNALSANKVAFRRLRVLLRDGTWFDFPGNAELEDLNIDQAAWPDVSEALEVHLVITSARQRQPVQSAHETGLKSRSRYLLQEKPEQLPDYYQPGEEVEAPLLTLYGKLVTRAQLGEMSGVESLPVCRLVHQQDQLLLDPDYLPPMLTVTAVPEMHQWLQSFRDELVARAQQLEDYKQAPTEYRNSDFNPRLLRYRLALQALARPVQAFTHLLELGEVPPERVYQQVRELIADLSCFSTTANVRGEMPGAGLKLPAYDHLQLGNCFAGARELVNRLLNEIALDSEALARFKEIRQGQYELDLPAHFLDSGQEMFLVLRTQKERPQWLRSFQQFSKLGTPALVPTYQSRALPGIAKQLLEVRPEGLPQRPNSTYFALQRNDDAWMAVEREGVMQLSWNDAPDDLVAELVTIKG
ncbi:type VI secretion system baseplate subunit TssK [Marinospirillum perlucidum]|uniref:type VI secretion system baseplate subunit TssK n=1 Tax=Marinospirillum perlucidum TaxID=1982602 RepID=UPI001390103C|nr:type VI secretion system baseplate subunit TssK [Marinospirillum perlucidum]